MPYINWGRGWHNGGAANCRKLRVICISSCWHWVLAKPLLTSQEICFTFFAKLLATKWRLPLFRTNIFQLISQSVASGNAWKDRLGHSLLNLLSFRNSLNSLRSLILKSSIFYGARSTALLKSAYHFILLLWWILWMPNTIRMIWSEFNKIVFVSIMW